MNSVILFCSRRGSTPTFRLGRIDRRNYAYVRHFDWSRVDHRPGLGTSYTKRRCRGEDDTPIETGT